MPVVQTNSYAVASKVVKTFAMNLQRFRGQKVAANDRWLQVHDAKALPGNGAVPVRSFAIYGAAPFDFNLEFSPIVLATGCVLAISSTEGTLTISVETMDLFVTGDSAYDDTLWDTIAGDYTTGAAGETPWADAAGPKRLRRLEFTALSDAGAVKYAKIFGSTSATAPGDKPLWQAPLPQNTSMDFFFDFIPQWKSAGTLYQGCSVVIDNVAGGYDGNYAGTDWAIKCSSDDV